MEKVQQSSLYYVIAHIAVEKSSLASQASALVVAGV